MAHITQGVGIGSTVITLIVLDHCLMDRMKITLEPSVVCYLQSQDVIEDKQPTVVTERLLTKCSNAGSVTQRHLRMIGNPVGLGSTMRPPSNSNPGSVSDYNYWTWNHYSQSNPPAVLVGTNEIVREESVLPIIEVTVVFLLV